VYARREVVRVLAETPGEDREERLRKLCKVWGVDCDSEAGEKVERGSGDAEESILFDV
jgi:hypothetical protein